MILPDGLAAANSLERLTEDLAEASAARADQSSPLIAPPCVSAMSGCLARMRSSRARADDAVVVAIDAADEGDLMSGSTLARHLAARKTAVKL